MSEKLIPLTEEQRGKTKSRILSDAELIKGGADIDEDGTLSAGEKLEEKIKQEEEGVYEEREVINGMLVSVRWIKPHQCYEVLVGQEEKRPEGMKAEEYFEKLIKGTPDYTENAGDTREQAKKVFLLVKQLVEKGKSLEEIHEMRGSDESES